MSDTTTPPLTDRPGPIFAAWLGFTLPSALAMAAFALLLTHVGGLTHGGWLHGFKLVAVAVVAQALWGMGRSLCPDRTRASLAVAALLADFYRAGALVFGGGHVVLPLLQAQVVPGGMDNATFLAGYGAAQAVPGPLFTFAAFLGAASAQGPGGWVGATVALLAIFLPGFLLVAGALPLWNALRSHPALRSALMGINAAVVGLLLAAFYDPVWTAAIHTPRDFALALAALLLLQIWKAPPWAVVLGGAAIIGVLG